MGTHPKGTNDPPRARPLSDQLKPWFEFLSKGYGLIASLTGLAAAGPLPFALPAAGGILIGFLVTFSFPFLLFGTFWAFGIRARHGFDTRGGLAALWLCGGLVFAVAFMWLFDAAPRWQMMHEYPNLVRALVAVPYAAAVGSFSAALVLVLPRRR